MGQESGWVKEKGWNDREKVETINISSEHLSEREY